MLRCCARRIVGLRFVRSGTFGRSWPGNGRREHGVVSRQAWEHLTGSHRVRHEPAALDMGQILADQPPGSGPSAVRALTCDALDAPLLADVVVTERDEPAPRRHLDTEEPAAAARARLGSAGGLRPRTRRRDSPPSLRLVDAAFHWVFFPGSWHRSPSSWVALPVLSRLGFNDSNCIGRGKGFFQPAFQRLLET